MDTFTLTAPDVARLRDVVASKGWVDGARHHFGPVQVITLDLDVVVLAELSGGREAKITVFQSWTSDDVNARVELPDPSYGIFSAADLALIVLVGSVAGLVAEVIKEAGDALVEGDPAMAFSFPRTAATPA